MRFTLDYARTGLSAELPDDRVAGPLAIPPAACAPTGAPAGPAGAPGLPAPRAAAPCPPPPAPPPPPPAAAVADALARPTGSRPLAEVARGRKDACVLICDITRPVPNRLI